MGQYELRSQKAIKDQGTGWSNKSRKITTINQF